MIQALYHQICLQSFFADDSNFLWTGDDVDSLFDMVNTELDKIVHWLAANRMSLNIEKTHYMIFAQKGKHVQSNKTICMNGSSISQVSSTKFDSNLSWKNHISYVRNKISKNVGIMARARKVLNCDTMLTLYYSMIYPYLSYCIHVWGSAFKSHLDKIIKIQKRIVRMMCGVSRKTHSFPLFQASDILNIEKVYEYTVGLLMYKFHHSQVPCIISELFIENSDIHSYFTRQSHLLHVPKCRTEIGKRSFRYKATI